MVDCVLAFAATELVERMTAPNSAEGRAMLERVKQACAAAQRHLPLSHSFRDATHLTRAQFGSARRSRA